MTNLHFANLHDGKGQPHLLSRDVTTSLHPVFKYLERARDEARERRLAAPWEAADAEPGRPDVGFWARLKPTQDPDADARLFKAFCEEDSLSDDSKGRSGNIRVLAFDDDEGTLLLARRPQGDVLYVHPKTWPLEAQVRAIRALQERPDPAHAPLARLCFPEWAANWPAVNRTVPPRWFVLTDDAIDGANEQREFVAKAMGTPDFALLEGPPGSGKTHTLCELILQVVSRGGRVMMCASTHVAVDNVLEKLHKLGCTDKQVVAVRIGSEQTVHPNLSSFRLENRARSEQANLVKRLRDVPARSPAQDLMLAACEASEGAELVRNLVLDAANLVCGTTIGILKFTAMSQNRGADITPTFDFLIVDEASKTTLAEFLVPALRAKRWVLVGDVQQLAPYTDGTSLEASLRRLVTSTEAQALSAAGAAAAAQRQKPTGTVLWVNDDSDARALARARAAELGIPTTELIESSTLDGSMGLLWAEFITSSREAYARHFTKLPPGTRILGPEKAPLLLRRRNALDPDFRETNPNLESPAKWDEAVAWRLTREFELRLAPEQKRRYTQELADLVPDKHTLFLADLRRAALPSILEVLQRGFGSDRHAKYERAIVNGLPDAARQARMVSLTYQHRMHPEISRFPRENVYEGRLLQDSSRVQKARAWHYQGYNARATWLNVNSGPTYPKNVATREIQVIEGQLREFLAWASSNPKVVDDVAHAWEVTLLTFYRTQERALRHLVSNAFPPKRLKNAVISVGNVDRFQGREADLVFLSFVRNPSQRDPLGFLDSPNRLNVALTRARHQLVLVGDRQGFSRRRERSPLLAALSELPEHKLFTQRGK